MNYLTKNRRMERIAKILILCVAPSLFIIPVLCGPIDTFLSSAKPECPIAAFVLSTGDPLILTEDISYLGNFKDSIFLGGYEETINLPLLFSSQEKPPKALA